jgi:hypothetical protein
MAFSISHEPLKTQHKYWYTYPKSSIKRVV